MKKLTIALFLALTGCAFDAADSQLPPFELADDVTGSVGSDSERPTLPPFELADEVVGELQHPHLPPFELSDDVVGELQHDVGFTHPNQCEPDTFVGCTSDRDAVFCGDDGRSLVVESCDFGCDADGCLPRDKAPNQFPVD